MNDCPSEVWTRIFSFACTDGGQTGRSLSCVNKYIGQASRDVMLQTVEIRGLEQLRRFARMLEKAPAHKRRVKHLYLSTYDHQPHEPCPPPERMFEFLYGHGASQTQMHPYKDFDVPRHEQHTGETTSTDILRVLSTLAPSLSSLHLTALSRDHILLPISLPHLSDLVIHGPFPSWSVDDLSVLPFPRLRRLSLSGFSDYPMALFSCISRLAPGLRELHLGPEKPTRVLFPDLQEALGDDSRTRLPCSLTEIVVHPGEIPDETKYWLIPVHRDMVDSVEELSRKDRRVKVSREPLTDPLMEPHESQICPPPRNC